MLIGLNDAESTDLILSVGTHRATRRATPVRVAELLEKASLYQGMDSIAEHLQLKDQSILRRFLSILKLPEETRAMISWGSNRASISFSAASEIARLKSPDEIQILTHAALTYRLSKSEIQATVQRSQRGDVSIASAVDEIVHLRPQIERQYLFIGRPQNADEMPDEIMRRLIRKKLSLLIGPDELVSVSVKNGKTAILVTEIGYQNKQINAMKNPITMGEFLTVLLDEE
jgi:hypothetical protein